MTTPPTANDAALAALITTLAAGPSAAPAAVAAAAAAAGRWVPAPPGPAAVARQGLRSTAQTRRFTFNLIRVRAHFCAKKGTRISNNRLAAQTRLLRRLADGKPIEVINTPLTTANGTVLDPVRCARCIATRGFGGRITARPAGGGLSLAPLVGWGSELAATPGAKIIWQASGAVVVPSGPQGRTLRLCPLCLDCARDVREEAELLRSRLVGADQATIGTVAVTDPAAASAPANQVVVNVQASVQASVQQATTAIAEAIVAAIRTAASARADTGAGGQGGTSA